MEAEGRPARFVGGCVRDGLSGRSVGNEIDLATPERPEQVIQLLERAGLPGDPERSYHGTVSTIANRRHFEITTLRRDVACDGRHAEVEFTDDFAADAARRDLTINAIVAIAVGQLYDGFGGRADLATGTVRLVGDSGGGGGARRPIWSWASGDGRCRRAGAGAGPPLGKRMQPMTELLGEDAPGCRLMVENLPVASV